MTAQQLSSHLKVRSLYDTYEPVVVENNVQQAADGTIVASADKAEIIGTSAKLEPGNPPNVGGWSDQADELDWIFQVDHPGTYRVLIDLACPRGVEGSEIAVDAGGSQATGVVPITGGWTKYEVLDLGTVRIDKAGSTTLTLRALKMPHGNVMNLRSISLKPAPAN
jgi:hypothetical protein